MRWNSQRLRTLVGTLTITVVLGTRVTAQLPPGRDGYCYPAGGKAGTTVAVTLGGSDWTPDVQFLTPEKRLKIQANGRPGPVLVPEPPYWIDIKSFANDPRLPREVAATITIPPTLPIGPIPWNVANANGAGPGSVFVVSNDDELLEDEARREPQTIRQVPCIMNGRLMRIEEVDRYWFHATQTGLLTCELMARRLGHDYHGVIEIHDDTGRPVAEAVDTLGRDPIVTFNVVQGTRYTISIRDLDHRGYRNFIYRLSLKPGPRCVATIPAAGQRGTRSTMTFLGYGIATGQAKLESVSRVVEFPADVTQATMPYQLETPFGTTPEISIPLSDWPEKLEESGRELQPPCAVTGRIRSRGDQAPWTFPGRKGEFWDFTVRGEAIAFRVLGTDRKTLLTSESTPDSHSVHATLTLPSEGNYQIVVTDHSGRQPKADSLYRMIVQRPEPSFRLQTPALCNVPLGGTTGLTIAITREGSGKEPVAITITGLPPGVTAPALTTLGPNDKQVTIPLTAARDAVVGSEFIRATGTATLAGRTVTRDAQGQYASEVSRLGTRVESPNLLLTTTLKPPFKVRAAEADGGRRIPRGSTHLAEIVIERTEGFAGEITLDMAGAQQRHRQGIRGPAVAVAPGQNKILYPVFLPEWLETSRTSRIGLVAMAAIPDPKGNMRYVLTPMEGQITMSIEGSLMKLSHAPEELTVTMGESLAIPLKLARSPQLTGPVTLEIEPPAALRDFLVAKPTIWPSTEPLFRWQVVTIADRRLLGIWPITLRATTLRDGHRVASETTIDVEFVDKPSENAGGKVKPIGKN